MSIAFRETVQRASVGERKYIRYFDGRGHFAHLKLQLVPRSGESCSITRSPELNIPEDCYHAARTAIARKLDAGPIAHLPMHGLEVRLLGGTYLECHSSPEAFAIAASMAFDDALTLALPVVLEPWTMLRLRVEDDVLTSVLQKLTRLVGLVNASISQSEIFVLDVEIPVRLLRPICQTLGLRYPRTSALPASRQYRPLQGSLPPEIHPQAGFGEWT